MGSLPPDLTSFVGRKRELGEIRRLLSTSRLVTLIGPGCAGKTRLARREAWDLRRSFSSGTWFVDLTELRSPQLLTQEVGNTEVLAHLVDSVLGLREQSDGPPLEVRTLAAFHVATGGYGQAQDIIAARTGVRIGRAQLTGLARDLAAWADDFYQLRARVAESDLPATDVIMMQADGKGIAVRPEHRKTTGTDTTRPGIKKMAEIVAVADVTPAVRQPDDIAAPPARRNAHPGPTARDGYLGKAAVALHPGDPAKVMGSARAWREEVITVLRRVHHGEDQRFALRTAVTDGAEPDKSGETAS